VARGGGEGRRGVNDDSNWLQDYNSLHLPLNPSYSTLPFLTTDSSSFLASIINRLIFSHGRHFTSTFFRGANNFF